MAALAAAGQHLLSQHIRQMSAAFATRVAVSFALILTVVACGPSADEAADGSPVAVGGHPLYGKAAPEIDLQTFDGERMTLSSLQGRPVIINFWATWCGPCREEFPLMVETYEARADDGLEILGILHDDTVEGGRAFAEDMGAEWPMLYDADDEAWRIGHRAAGPALMAAAGPPLLLGVALIVAPPAALEDWFLFMAVVGVATGGLLALGVRQAREATSSDDQEQERP